MKKEVVIILKNALEEKEVKLKEDEIENLIETPPNPDMGDYAFPCFILAKEMKENPSKIAIEVREKIGGSYEDYFEDVQTQGPYINFFLDRKVLALNLIEEISKKKEKFGSLNVGQGKKVLIEHTSINPNASPHVGRARNAILGDSVVRILKFQGFKPEAHYYVNDVSKQIAMLVLAKAEKLKFESMLKRYVKISKEVKKSKKKEKEVFDLLKKFEEGDVETVKKFNKITKTCIEGQKKILSKLGIYYDYFDYESSYLKRSDNIIGGFKETKKLFLDEDGRKVLNLKGTPVEGKMKSPVLVLTRSDETGLYPLRDIAYTIDKMKKSDFNIVVLGEDQKLYFQQIEEALKLLNKTSPRVIHYSFILLSEGKKSRKMSTRKGEVVLLEDFFEKAVKKAGKKSRKKSYAKPVAISAIKYSILKNHPDKTINFNLDEALSFDGNTGPYLLYSYARANSILKKTKRKKEMNIYELEQKEIELIKKISIFPEIVSDAHINMNPSLIANYSYQLAQIFNEFYHECRVMGSSQERFRIELVKSFKQVLQNSLSLLGIETIEEM